MIIHPFKALRATPASAPRLGSAPYDVVDRAEAAALARDNALSFLHVVRSEIDLDPAADPYGEAVYARAAENLQALCAQGHLVVEDRPCLYAYRLTMGAHRQLGVLGCCSVDEYERGVIKRHELTRRDKEDDRTRHILATQAHTGPVLIAYRDAAQIDERLAACTQAPALLSCESETGVVHEIWPIDDPADLVADFAALPHAYIADGHHRSASAARACETLRGAGDAHSGAEEHNFFLAALFPASQLKILAYNRVVSDLGGQSPDQILQLAAEKFHIQEAVSPAPQGAGRFCVYLAGLWHELTIKAQYVPVGDPVRSLDCALLQEHFIEPLLGIGDLRGDKRIAFVGGVRGTEALEQRVDKGGDGIGFSLHPTTVEQLMAVADAGMIMPPKSTWFEPKLRSGLVVHCI